MRCRQVRNVHRDPCLFEQCQGIAPSVSRSFSSVSRLPSLSHGSTQSFFSRLFNFLFSFHDLRSFSARGKNKATPIEVRERILHCIYPFIDGSRTTLLSVAITTQHNQHRAQDDLQIKKERPVFDIEQIQLHHLFEGQAISARNLP